MNREAVFANALNMIDEIGAGRLLTLKQFFGTFEKAWHASGHDLIRCLGDRERVCLVENKRIHIEPEKEYQLLKQAKISIILSGDPEFPTPLHKIPTPPAILYVEGTLPSFDKTPALAVVGTRTPTSYGLQACQAIVEPLARRGVCIVSGLAAGIDTKAHTYCLEAGGVTVAVVGSGLARSVLYPAANTRLADGIVAGGGALLSEYPPFMGPQSWTFPQRNRIIAGLTAGTLIVEAKERSGTRITARYALDFGKDVFAIPGSIFSATSKTPHMLIQEGAIPVTSAEDVLYALGLREILPPSPISIESANVSPEEKTLLDFLTEPLSANDIARGSGIAIATVNGLLMHLEIRGIVRSMGNGTYRKI